MSGFKTSEKFNTSKILQEARAISEDVFGKLGGKEASTFWFEAIAFKVSQRPILEQNSRIESLDSLYNKIKGTPIGQREQNFWETIYSNNLDVDFSLMDKIAQEPLVQPAKLLLKGIEKREDGFFIMGIMCGGFLATARIDGYLSEQGKSYGHVLVSLEEEGYVGKEEYGLHIMGPYEQRIKANLDKPLLIVDDVNMSTITKNKVIAQAKKLGFNPAKIYYVAVADKELIEGKQNTDFLYLSRG